MSPVELVKVRLQLADGVALNTAATATATAAAGGSGGGAGAGAFALATGVVRSVGLSGLLSRGLGATMGRDVLPHGVWFATYEWCKQEFSLREGVKPSDNGALSVGAQLASGGVAATIAWLVGESSQRPSVAMNSRHPFTVFRPQGTKHRGLFVVCCVLWCTLPVKL